MKRFSFPFVFHSIYHRATKIPLFDTLTPVLPRAALFFTIVPQLAFAQTRWIATWGAAPSPQFPSTGEMEKAKLVFSNATVREIVHVSLGGSQIRVRLSNAFGKQPVQIASAHIALRAKGASIRQDSDHTLTFSGERSITIPPDAILLSDPVSLTLAPESDLVVSLYLPDRTEAGGIHYDARQTNYSTEGDRTGVAELPNPSSFSSWVFLAGVDIAAPNSDSTLVAFGDSITDGAASTKDANHRWPNFFASRIQSRHVAVIDEGIGGNRVLRDPNQNIAFGISALARFDRDVLAQPGVKYVVVLEGINDLGHAGPDLFPSEQANASDIIAGLKQLAARAHEKGLKIYGATLTPFAGTVFKGYFSEAKETQRKAINQWIRASGAFDGVIDFDKATQDPAHPDHIRPDFDSGDHLHPNDAGYQAMAKAIDLSLFR
ncbi:MAG TPA: SGNH/GDSL hydrolase family protein [Bryobacteraceae bacterium]|jgi:lysophospholipase L1-like esterase|nr:SGNH/GDSL hydrolase family protein [Bryobacteraceae bacterium]